jgi:hypothetical protein
MTFATNLYIGPSLYVFLNKIEDQLLEQVFSFVTPIVERQIDHGATQHCRPMVGSRCYDPARVKYFNI